MTQAKNARIMRMRKDTAARITAVRSKRKGPESGLFLIVEKKDRKKSKKVSRGVAKVLKVSIIDCVSSGVLRVLKF